MLLCSKSGSLRGGLADKLPQLIVAKLKLPLLSSVRLGGTEAVVHYILND